MYKATIEGEAYKIAEAKQRSKDNPHGYVYVPRSWLQRDVVLLAGVEGEPYTMDTHEGAQVSATCEGFSEPSVYKKGDSCACHVNREFVPSNCVIVLNPGKMQIEKTSEAE